MFEQRWYRVNTPFAGYPVKGFFAQMSRAMVHNADAWNHARRHCELWRAMRPRGRSPRGAHLRNCVDFLKEKGRKP